MLAEASAHLVRGSDRAIRGARRAVGAIERVRPLYVLAPVVVVQWVVVVVLARTAKHNGWLWYTGGDGALYHTASWNLGHLRIPPSFIGYGIPVFTGPISALGGVSLFGSLRAIVLLQVLVLLPLEVVLVYGIGRRLGSRLHGYAVATLVVLSPLVGLRFWRADYRTIFHDLFVPQWLGLTNLGDFGSTVAIVGAAYATFRALDRRAPADAVLAGLLAAFAVGIKPGQALFLPAPLVAFAAARRWRQLIAFGVALAPAVLTLALWKLRGLGYLPILHTQGELREAASFAPPLVGANPVQHYLGFSWHHLSTNLDYIREYGWSRRLAEWIPVAGFVGALRRDVAKGLLLGVWCAMFLVVKGGAAVAAVSDTSYFRLTMPGLPAYLLLATCIPYAWPGRRALPAREREEGFALRPTRGLVAAAVLLAAVPLVVVAVARPTSANAVVRFPEEQLYAPASSIFHVSIHRGAAGVEVAWSPPAHGSSDVAYTVFRGTGDGCSPVREQGVQFCTLTMQRLGYTALRRFVDEQGSAGATYRVAMTASIEPGKPGDELLISPPVRAR